MNATRHRAVEEYLNLLRRSLDDLPRDRRREIVAEIEEHIEEALAELHSPATEADVRNVLDRVGEPAEIAAAARERFGVTRSRLGGLEIAAILLLLVGGLVVPVVGWIAGVVLLWVSDAWTRSDKLIGTFVIPGGLALAPFLVMALPLAMSQPTVCIESGDERGVIEEVCSAEPSLVSGAIGIVLVVLVVVAPFFTAFFLARRARRAQVV